MSSQRLAGIALLAAGGLLFFFGVNASHSLADRFSEFFTGHYSDATTWYLFGGIASMVSGLLMLTLGRTTANA